MYYYKKLSLQSFDYRIPIPNADYRLPMPNSLLNLLLSNYYKKNHHIKSYDNQLQIPNYPFNRWRQSSPLNKSEKMGVGVGLRLWGRRGECCNFFIQGLVSQSPDNRYPVQEYMSGYVTNINNTQNLSGWNVCFYLFQFILPGCSFSELFSFCIFQHSSDFSKQERF